MDFYNKERSNFYVFFQKCWEYKDNLDQEEGQLNDEIEGQVGLYIGKGIQFRLSLLRKIEVWDEEV